MKLIMKTEFDNLRTNTQHSVESDINGEKKVVKVYFYDQLIAKKITLKKSVRYFGASGYQHFIINEVD